MYTLPKYIEREDYSSSLPLSTSAKWREREIEWTNDEGGEELEEEGGGGRGRRGEKRSSVPGRCIPLLLMYAVYMYLCAFNREDRVRPLLSTYVIQRNITHPHTITHTQYNIHNAI